MSITKMASNVPQIIYTNKVEAIRFTVVLSFESFSSRLNRDSFYDSKIFSPPGKPEGPHFFLRLKPKRYFNYTNTHYVKLEFHLANSAVAEKCFRVHHSTAIVSQSGEKYGQPKESTFTTNDDKSWLLFEHPHQELFDPSKGLLPDDTLTFCSELTFYLEHDTEEVLFSCRDRYESRGFFGVDHQQQQQLVTDLKRLYESKAFADVILQSGGEQFPAHKALLTARSPVFAAMFEHPTTKESMEGRVVIEDVSAEVLHLLLTFLYTGVNLTVELLAAADKYQVDSLKAICAERIAAGLTVQTMFPTLLIADLYSAPELKSRTMDFIAHQTSIQDRVKALLNVNDSPEKVIALLQKVAQLESSPIESNGGQRFSTAGGRSLTSFVWAVEDFERLDQTRYDSPTFIAPQNTRLFLALHPRGSNAFWSNSHTLLYLYLKSTDREKHLQLTYSLSLLNVDKQECDIQEGKAAFFKQSSKWVMRLNWQYNILRDYLLDGQNKFFHRDGRLRVVCKVKIFEQDYVRFESLTIPRIVSSLGALFAEEKLTDVTLRFVGEAFQEGHIHPQGEQSQELKAHKAILAAGSPIFSAMFENDTVEQKRGVVEITDFDYDTMEQLLTFLYTGKIPPMETFAEQLLAASDKYQVDALKDICEDYLVSVLAADTVAGLLLLADLHTAANLRLKCINFIVRHPEAVMATEGWKQIRFVRPELGVELFQHLAKHVKAEAN
ncbi:hypothetical protein TYRP_022365 [Tyrophagus putrescentiae]|nr:hypothetical protein TYRP_022365 [Tyrophagus putrescentiae]